jgi:hypothetical protein
MKCYAIWNDKRQRFISDPIYDKTAAEIELAVLQKAQPGNKYYIFEWEFEDNVN